MHDNRPGPASLAALLALSCLLVSCATSEGAAPKPGKTLRDCPDCPEMMVLPAGEFVMGAAGGEPDRPEGPPHAVKIGRSFALGVYEVTHKEFLAFVDATGYEPARGCRVFRKGEWAHESAASWRDPGYGRPPAGNEPAGCITWRDAQAYVAWLSSRTGQRYRLPTEAEWEYAARAGTTTPWYWGDDPDAACDYANIHDRSTAVELTFSWEPADCSDSAARVAPVGSYEPNGFRLYDMLGNVWEWTADCYVAPYPPGHADGSAVEVAGTCERRSVRGGSWITRISRSRVTFRGRDPETAAYAYFGFRVARDL